MANPTFDTANILEFLSDSSNVGLENWNVVFEGGESDTTYDIEGLGMIKCMKRAIYHSNKNVVQISARRRVMTGGTEGKFALTKEEIALAEKKCREAWGADEQKKHIPVRAYFEYLPTRNPIFVVMQIIPNEPDGDEPEKLSQFRGELGSDPIIAFAIGCPGIREAGKAVTYKVNKIFQRLNIEGDEPEEDDDEE